LFRGRSATQLHEGRSRLAVADDRLNRHFSPAAVRAKELVSVWNAPLIVDYRMNAVYIPPDHWVHGDEGGGRNIGEACHIYDLFNFLTDADVTSVQAQAIRSRSRQRLPSDNFVAMVAFQDGSVCTLTYTGLGHRAHPKEHAEIFIDGEVLSVEDYKVLRRAGSQAALWRSRVRQEAIDRSSSFLRPPCARAGHGRSHSMSNCAQ
jgi:predicted dehydrogenase